MNAFITGSHAYGTPGPESDIDLVVCLDGSTDDEHFLWDNSDNGGSCRFGKLNLITLSPEKFKAWKAVNDELIKRDHSVGREEAIAAFNAAGFGYSDYGQEPLCEHGTLP